MTIQKNIILCGINLLIFSTMTFASQSNKDKKVGKDSPSLFSAATGGSKSGSLVDLKPLIQVAEKLENVAANLANLRLVDLPDAKTLGEQITNAIKTLNLAEVANNIKLIDQKQFHETTVQVLNTLVKIQSLALSKENK